MIVMALPTSPASAQASAALATATAPSSRSRIDAILYRDCGWLLCHGCVSTQPALTLCVREKSSGNWVILLLSWVCQPGSPICRYLPASASGLAQGSQDHRPLLKEIVRTLSVSRATVRKVIRGHKTEFKYARGVQPTPKLGEWVEVLTEILAKESNLPKRERRSTQRLFEELRGRGYDGAHDSVHRFVKAWRDERTRVPVHAYVPMSFAPGEAYQFDPCRAVVWAIVSATAPYLSSARPAPASPAAAPACARSPAETG